MVATNVWSIQHAIVRARGSSTRVKPSSTKSHIRGSLDGCVATKTQMGSVLQRGKDAVKLRSLPPFSIVRRER
jgi:hypothetical protein